MEAASSDYVKYRESWLRAHGKYRAGLTPFINPQQLVSVLSTGRRN